MKNDVTSESLRWWPAFSGVLLWFFYFFVQFEIVRANGSRYCAEHAAAGQSCNYDYIPILELFVVPGLILLLAYPFVRFAFGIYAPNLDRRRFGWRLAGRTDGIASYPVGQLLCGLGLCWSLWRLSTLPFQFISPWVIAYWIGWALWFVGALIVSWPKDDAEQL